MKVLIAIDDSDCSKAALDDIAARVWPEDVSFRIITVIEPMYIQAPMIGAYMDPIIDAHYYVTKDLQKMLSEKEEQLKKAFPKAQVDTLLIEGMAAESIIDQAFQWKPDLLVVGSHGRKGFERFMLGSVAERVASHAPCSVEIVKQKAGTTTKQAHNKKTATVV